MRVFNIYSPGLPAIHLYMKAPVLFPAGTIRSKRIVFYRLGSRSFDIFVVSDPLATLATV